ncbi:hypothetical protein [Pedobacter xixiisoli]|uniref:hypothetical protein n=1 Tax=Pedobacter xixiisoli TaxID=1476464 RepID=UPI00110CE352|nr:hypothetical protein [Pedobacter xixiisoli]
MQLYLPFENYLMLRGKTLKDIYATFLTEDGNPFEHKNILDTIKTGGKSYQAEILQLLETAIADKNINKLRFCLAASFRDGLDKNYSNSFYQLILATWHEEHKNLIDAVCRLKDERFCEALLEIALNKFPYRKFDDGEEIMLKKCVHSLKAIATEKADLLLEQLLATGNSNVEQALEEYDHSNPCADVYGA